MVIKAKEVGTATSPKRSHLLKVYGKLAGAYRRHIGELSRTRSSATGAVRVLAQANEDFERVLMENLGISNK